MDASELRLIAIAVGNTRTRMGRFDGRTLHDPVSVPNADGPEVVGDAVSDLLSDEAAQVVVASVNDPFAQLVERRLSGDLPVGGVWRAGRDLVIAMPNTLTNDSTVGADRWLNALAAFVRARQACVVIDAGTAVTVDFVDGEGVFHGGAIAPGVRMMLDALSEGASALPAIDWEAPSGDSPFGADTPDAMRHGVAAAVRGLVRDRVEAYAEAFGAYPQVVATGGDAVALFEASDLVEHIVPDLQLIGLQVACERALGEDGFSLPGVIEDGSAPA